MERRLFDGPGNLAGSRIAGQLAYRKKKQRITPGIESKDFLSIRQEYDTSVAGGSCSRALLIGKIQEVGPSLCRRPQYLGQVRAIQSGSPSNQPVAMENARLIGRMEHDEIVRANFSRYKSIRFVSVIETMPFDQMMSVLNGYFTAMTWRVLENAGGLPIEGRVKEPPPPPGIL